jgi:hypothetical protein
MHSESGALAIRSDEERGPWPTSLSILLVLIPLSVGLAIGIAMDGKASLGPLTATQLLWWVLLPLGAIYPAVAAVARIQAHAPTTVLVVAAIAPASLFAARLLLEALPTDRAGHTTVSVSTIAQTALPPAILAVAAFIAIEIATAGIRRGVLLGVVCSIIAAIVFGIGAVASMLPLLFMTT